MSQRQQKIVKKVSRELEMSQPESANRKRQTGRAARRKTTGRR